MKKTLLKAVIGCAAVAGIAQADIIHQTTKWQSLGYETIADGAATNSNNGVFWRLNAADGWTQLVSGAEFSVGQTVEFKVDVWKEFQGTHYSDVAKVWIDDIAQKTGEWKLADNGNKKWGSSYYDGNVTTGSQAAGNPEFLGDMRFTYTFDTAKEFELVARAMCSDDLRKLVNDNGGVFYTNYVTDNNTWGYNKPVYLPSAADWAAFTTTNPGTTLQGEIERYTINVRNVPEPTTLSLIGFSLLSLAFIRRKK